MPQVRRDDPVRPVALADGDELLSTADVAAILNKPIGTLRQWRHRGFGPRGFRMGAAVMYRRSAVEGFLAECETAGNGPPAA